MKNESMIYRKSILGFCTVPAIVLILVTTLPTGITTKNAQAQSTDISQQIRDYLIQAIQALDKGDNSEAIRQLQLATDQIGTSFTAISEQSNGAESAASREGNNNDGSKSGENNGRDGENDDEGEGSEEGSGEDEDEPGDVDTNDEED
jgi:hypothetical protein